MDDENLELNNYIFIYEDKIKENGEGIVYQYINKDVVFLTEQIQTLYKEIQNIIPSISFQLKFKNDTFESLNDENYYIDITCYNNISQETKRYIDTQLITQVSFTKVKS